MAQNLTNYAAILKEYYNPDRVAKMILASSPFLAMLPKKQIFGESWELPVIYAGTAGRSSSFSTALTNKGQTVSTKFQITTNPDYSLASLTRILMLASRNNMGAFLPAAKVNIDDAMMQLRRSIAINAFRDGSGARGRISTITGSNLIITLTERADIVNFQVSDVIQLSATKTGGAVRTGTVSIVAVNRSAGTFTVNTDITAAISGATTSDYIYQEGDYDAVLKGLGAWVPQSAPGATSFFGVNRSLDTDMLGGVRYDGSGMLRYEALIQGQSEIAMIGDGRPTHAFCNPIDFRQVVMELEAQVRRPRPVDITLPVRKDSNATVGFVGIAIEGDAGTIQLFSDRFCEPGVCYVLQLDDWKLAHIGPELVDIVGRDSDEGMLVETSSDGYEVRVASYPQLACAAPGHSGVVYNWGA